jgi:hypothetical protein
MPKSFVGKMLSSNCYFTAKPMDLGASGLLYFLNRTLVIFADNDYGDIVRNRLFEFDSNGQLVRTTFEIERDQQISQKNQI